MSREERIDTEMGGGDTKCCPQRKMVGRPRGERKLGHQRITEV